MVFTGHLLFLSPCQQWQSIEGKFMQNHVLPADQRCLLAATMPSINFHFDSVDWASGTASGL